MIICSFVSLILLASSCISFGKSLNFCSNPIFSASYNSFKLSTFLIVSFISEKSKVYHLSLKKLSILSTNWLKISFAISLFLNFSKILLVASENSVFPDFKYKYLISLKVISLPNFCCKIFKSSFFSLSACFKNSKKISCKDFPLNFSILRVIKSAKSSAIVDKSSSSVSWVFSFTLSSCFSVFSIFSSCSSIILSSAI